MVGPGGRADPDFCIGLAQTQKLGRHTQGAAAARCLDDRYATVADQWAVAAQDQLRHGAVEAGGTGRAHVALGGFALKQATLGFVHGGHDRRIAGVILIDTDAQIHFVRSIVFTEGLHQLQDRILGQGLECFKHDWPPR